MNNQVILWLKKEYGYDISSDYYSLIDIWLDWWRGYHKPYHRISFNNGKKTFQRDLYTLKMGKKICEDWASMLLNSKTHIKISDENTSVWLQGKRETEGILGANSFWTKGNRLIERAFATGTGAVTIHVSGIKLSDNSVSVSPEAEIQLRYLSAEYIIPLSVDNDSITEAAFCSETVEGGRKYLTVEVHRLNQKRHYVIETHRFLIDNGMFKPEELPPSVIKRLETKSGVPWFSIFMPNIENNVEYANGLGLSVLHNAIDSLKAVDLCFNNLCSDFYLGQKKVFMEKSLIDFDEDGNEVAPDDVHQQMFTYVSFPVSDESKRFIMEFNPQLRVEENVKGIQAQLDYLSFKCGLGNKHYQFNSGTVVTATQYTGDKQDLIQNADKHYTAVERFLVSLMRSIIYIGGRLTGANVKDNADIEICFDRSVIIDEAAERLQDSQDVRDGLMAKWEYRMKYYGETEEDARAVIDEISGSQDDDVLMGFGGA